MNDSIPADADVELAATYFLTRAQLCASALGLPDFSGDEDDDALHDVADSAFEAHPRGPQTEQLAADLFAYRLIRDTTDLQCADTAAHRIELIAEGIQGAHIAMSDRTAVHGHQPLCRSGAGLG